MGAHHSKRPDTPSVLLDDGGAGGGRGDIRYMAELSSYEAACRLDPELQGFDSTLQRCTSRVISSLALGVEVRSLSLDSLREITSCLLEMNQEVVKVILECKRDIWKTPELFDLVEDYFENSLHTLDFCAALEKCLKKARDGQLIIQVALQHFAEEEAEPEPQKDAKKKYSRTLEELRLFKAAGDPFTEEFFQVFHSVHRQQLLMLEKLQQRKNKLDKKLRSIKAWRRVSSTIFAATFAAVLICSVVAAAVAAPPVAAALAAAASIPIGSMGKWIDSLLQDYQNAVKGQREVLRSMQVGTYVAIKDMESIRVLIDKVEMEMASLLGDAEFVMEDADAVRIGMEEIRKKVEVFMRSVEEVGEQADGCSRDIRRARTVVLQRIIRNPE
ncbi:hypothetical protein OPV22_008995 [Ensete ventricosum]|uniref:Uncharacterized protein n=1 Tax=Ensete ventricosum TaxID=4639 RepID=A0A427B012_ENSVE|nr:hypothetical protein OPV22_008995 [Ensete ventricosum]RRT81872.1 hypothetical protein B296_00014983 [Ensete ventricosum]RWW18567.1 hypothetical protein GW17_00017447 [Ensete ventricosum]RZR82847.1 hypothetical protein BHM03_00009375 [Ensete ventricosum]